MPTLLQLAAALLLLGAATTHAQIINPDNLIAPPPRNPARPMPKPNDDMQWLWQYTRPAPNGDELGLLKDHRLSVLLQTYLQAPQSFWRDGKLPLSKVAQQYLGVTQGGVQSADNRYVSLTGCVPHECPNQGLLWIDTLPSRSRIIFAATDWTTQARPLEDPDADFTLWIFPSRSTDSEHLPTAFLNVLNRWNHPGHIKTAIVVSPDGTPHPVNPASLTASSTDQPSPTK